VGEREGEPNVEAAFGLVEHFETLVVAVEFAEAGAAVGGADAFAGETAGGHAGAVVDDGEDEVVVFAGGADGDEAAADVGFDAVADGVFDERLEDEIGDLGVERGGVDFHADIEAIAETDLFNAEVTFQKSDLGAEGGEGRAGLRHGHAEKLGELDEHAVGGIDVGIHERRDAVEGVEEEVGFELAEEGLEAGFGEVFFELEGLDGALVVFAVVVERVADGDDDAVDEEIEREGFDEERLEDFEKRRLFADDRGVGDADRGAEHDVEKREAEGGGEVDAGGAPGDIGFGRKAAGEPGDRQGEKRPDIPIRERVTDGFAPSDGAAEHAAREVELAGEGEADEGPENEKAECSKDAANGGAGTRHRENVYSEGWRLVQSGRAELRNDILNERTRNRQ